MAWKCWHEAMELPERLTRERQWQTHKTELPELWPKPSQNYRNDGLEVLADPMAWNY